MIEAYLGDPALAAEFRGALDDERRCSKLQGLEAGYGEVQVLWGISLGRARGELTTIVGANGAGKTTTLRAVVGGISPVAAAA